MSIGSSGVNVNFVFVRACTETDHRAVDPQHRLLIEPLRTSSLRVCRVRLSSSGHSPCSRPGKARSGRRQALQLTQDDPATAPSSRREPMAFRHIAPHAGCGRGGGGRVARGVEHQVPRQIRVRNGRMRDLAPLRRSRGGCGRSRG